MNLLTVVACICLLCACSKSDEQDTFTPESAIAKDTASGSGHHWYDPLNNVYCNQQQVDSLASCADVHYTQYK